MLHCRKDKRFSVLHCRKDERFSVLHCQKDKRFSVLHCRKDKRFSVLHCRKDDAALPERRRCIARKTNRSVCCIARRTNGSVCCFAGKTTLYCRKDDAALRAGATRTVPRVSGGPKSVADQRGGRRVLPAGGGRGVLQTVSVKQRHAAPHLPSRLITAHVGASATQGVPFHFNGGVTAG